MDEFIPGLRLGEMFHQEVVRPLLNSHFPDLRYDAALIGPGSEVIGYDTPISMDHHWLPYLHLFLDAADFATLQKPIHDTLADGLPPTWRGFSTNWTRAEDEPVTMLQAFVEKGPVNHRVTIHFLPDWLKAYAGLDWRIPSGNPTLLDWLLTPEQILLSLTSGQIYHHGLGQVRALQEKLSYYPAPVWRYLLHAQWSRIGQEEPFVGRAGDAGDEAGSALIAARLVADIMRLTFFVERQYAPYSKHFGAAFARLDGASELAPHLEGALQAARWPIRERHLGAAYQIAARRFNKLGLIPRVTTELSNFHSRPFQVIHGGDIADALWESIVDSAVKILPRGVGKVDQCVDSTDVLSNPDHFRSLAGLYQSA